MTRTAGRGDARVLTATGTTAGGPRCWNSIGTWGDVRPRCSMLDTVIHCRNCEVFAAAGRELLDRELPEAYGVGRTEGVAAQLADERVECASVLIFRLGSELLALPLEVVVEIAEWRLVHSLPHRRDDVLLGVANVGGGLRLCVSLEALFGSQPAPMPEPGNRGRLIVIGDGKPEWLVPAHETLSVHRVALDSLGPPPATIERSTAAFVRGIFPWRNLEVPLLDADLVLSALMRRLG